MAVQIPLADAQELLVADLPAAIRDTVDRDTLITSIAVYLDDGEDPDEMATIISQKVDDVSAMGPAGFETSVKEPLKIFNQIIYAIAVVSLLVGGLSVINTMTMSVAERTREIGVRKAIGATDGAIMRQFIAESAVMGVIGGLLGLGLGALVGAVGNQAGAQSATELFLLTPRLAAGSVGFALVLGIVSGLYPAWHAARLNPVRALRYE
jgi:putative ABC transport system permease protein